MTDWHQNRVNHFEEICPSHLLLWVRQIGLYVHVLRKQRLLADGSPELRKTLSAQVGEPSKSGEMRLGRARKQTWL